MSDIVDKLNSNVSRLEALRSASSKQKTLISYQNGNYDLESNLKVPFNDLGFLRGYAVFEYLRTYQKVPFCLDEHILRLKNSLQNASLNLPVTFSRLKEIIAELLEINRNISGEVSFKIIVTAGISSSILPELNKETLTIVVQSALSYHKSYYERGASLISLPFGRLMHDTKSLFYMPALSYLNKERKRQESINSEFSLPIEALYTDAEGNYLEATTSNFFAIKGNRLITSETGVLDGITKNVVLEIARSDFVLERRSISPVEEIEEAFITSSNKEIMPVVKIDEKIIGDGKVGKHTKIITKKFLEYVGKKST